MARVAILFASCIVGSQLSRQVVRTKTQQFHFQFRNLVPNVFHKRSISDLTKHDEVGIHLQVILEIVATNFRFL